MKEVKFGIVGCGFIGEVHAEIISTMANAKLVACCDKDTLSGKNMSEKYKCKYYDDMNKMLENDEIDAVTICLPSGLHSVATISVAKSGKHVLCEKPIDIDLKRAQEMVDVTRECGVKFGVIMQHRFDPPIVLLKKALEDGTLGKVIWGSSRTIWYRDEKYFDNPWRGTWAVDGGGALINQSVHYIDLLLSILGEVRSVSAKCRTLLHHQIEVEDVGIANLEFSNGSLGTIEGTTTAYPGHYAELSIFCENGSVIIRNDELLSYNFKSGKNDDFEKILNPEKANNNVMDTEVTLDSHRKQYEDFVQSIIENKKPLVTGEDALKSLRVIKSIYQASNEKREIYL